MVILRNFELFTDHPRGRSSKLSFLQQFKI